MTKAQKAIKELEIELNEFVKQIGDIDLRKMQHPAKMLATMSFYQAQAFKKVFERLDEIENKIK